MRSKSQRVFQLLQAGFWNRHEWQPFKQEVEILARSLQKYCDILEVKKQRTFANHHSQQQVRSLENSLSVQLIQQRHTVPHSLAPLCKQIIDAGIDTPVSLQDADVLPQDRKRRYEYIESVKRGLQVPVIFLTHSSGGNNVNLHWIWHTTADSINSAFQTCQPIIERIKTEIPQYHTRAMRQLAFEKYGLISPSVKKSVMRHMYQDLVGDDSAADTTPQAEIDARMATFFDLEEPGIVPDLRHVYSGNGSKFDLFWGKAKEFLEEDIGTAVDDRRHSEIVHLAKAVSVRDLREQVCQCIIHGLFFYAYVVAVVHVH